MIECELVEVGSKGDNISYQCLNCNKTVSLPSKFRGKIHRKCTAIEKTLNVVFTQDEILPITKQKVRAWAIYQFTEQALAGSNYELIYGKSIVGTTLEKMFKPFSNGKPCNCAHLHKFLDNINRDFISKYKRDIVGLIQKSALRQGRKLPYFLGISAINFALIMDYFYANITFPIRIHKVGPPRLPHPK